MSPEISERSFEDAIECGLLQHGPDACIGEVGAVRETSPPFGETPPGGYRRRRPEEYDRALCLLPRDVLDFVLATQPKVWKKLEQHHGAAVKEQFLRRLATEIERRGALDVLRNGVKDSGCGFRLAYFRAASGLSEETRWLHAGNLFAVVRQVRYSTKNENCLDLVLFLNGIPIFTAELKNPLNGQDVEDAIGQCKTDRDPREPLFAYGRCLGHFAVDPNLVYVTTRLAWRQTRFLPFNQGNVDKKLGGVNAVQTLSRLNRTHAEKRGTAVLDFANEADEIKAAFEPYYETTLLSEATDPNLLYEVQQRLAAFPVYTDVDVNAFAKVYFDARTAQDRLYAVLAPIVARFQTLSREEQQDFRGHLTDYVRLYAFLAQVITFADADLEKLYVFARHLRRLLPGDRAELPREVQQNIDMESYRIQQTASGRIALERRPGVLEPVSTRSGYVTGPESSRLFRSSLPS